MSRAIIEKMMKLGFTLYESRAYTTLLQDYPATRYEISKRSDVPRSAIYTVIQRLESAGIVNALSSEPKKYMPLPPEKLLNLIEKRQKSEIDEFRESVSEVHVGIERGHLWNISGYKNLILKAREIILNTHEQLYISAWTRELNELEEELRDARERGVKIVIFSLTHIPRGLGKGYSYELDEDTLDLSEKRNLIVARDMEELLMGEANMTHPKKAAWTQNEAFIEISVNYIIQDIMLFGLRTGSDVGDIVNGITGIATNALKMPDLTAGNIYLTGKKLRKLVTKIPFTSIEEQS